MINSRIELDFVKTLDMLDVGEDLLGKLYEEGRVKSRRVDRHWCAALAGSSSGMAVTDARARRVV
jgi:hypothetical protein